MRMRGRKLASIRRTCSSTRAISSRRTRRSRWDCGCAGLCLARAGVSAWTVRRKKRACVSSCAISARTNSPADTGTPRAEPSVLRRNRSRTEWLTSSRPPHRTLARRPERIQTRTTRASVPANFATSPTVKYPRCIVFSDAAQDGTEGLSSKGPPFDVTAVEMLDRYLREIHSLRTGTAR